MLAVLFSTLGGVSAWLVSLASLRGMASEAEMCALRDIRLPLAVIVASAALCSLLQIVTPLEPAMAGLIGMMVMIGEIDRRTAWAPLRTMWICVMVASIAGAQHISAMTVFLPAIILMGVALGLWMLQRASNYELLPPSDAAALGLPLLVLPFDFHIPAVLMAVSVAGIVILRSPALQSFFAPRAAVSSAREDVALPGDGTAVPLLGWLFPVYAAALPIASAAGGL